jgi:hypothetical protein
VILSSCPATGTTVMAGLVPRLSGMVLACVMLFHSSTN